MRGVPTAIRILSVAFFALLFSACNGNGGVSPVPQDAQNFVGGIHRQQLQRQDPACRHHRSGEPQLQQSVLRISRRQDRQVRIQYERAEDHAGADRPGNDLGYRTPVGRVFSGLQRHGQLSRHRLPDERFRQRILGVQLVPERAVQLRAAQRNQAILLSWASTTFWPTRCSPRTSMPAALSRISTSSPVRPAPPSTILTAAWGCEGGSGDHISTITQERQYGSYIPMCFNNNTLGAEMDTAGLSWAYYASSVYGDGGIWSAYQNIAPIYNGPDWSKDVITPADEFLHRRFKRQAPRS